MVVPKASFLPDSSRGQPSMMALGDRAIYDERKTGEQMPTLTTAHPFPWEVQRCPLYPRRPPGGEQEPPPACPYLRRRGSQSSWKRAEAAVSTQANVVSTYLSSELLRPSFRARSGAFSPNCALSPGAAAAGACQVCLCVCLSVRGLRRRYHWPPNAGHLPEVLSSLWFTQSHPYPALSPQDGLGSPNGPKAVTSPLSELAGLT